MAESRLGEIQMQFRDDEGHQCVISVSEDRETLRRMSETSETIEGREVRKWVELTTFGGADPDMRVRVEVRDGAPQIVELAWTSQPDQGEIRQKHLKQVDLAKLATDIAMEFIVGIGLEVIPRPPDPSLPFAEERERYVRELKQSKRVARTKVRKFVERQRRPREYRVITDSFLKSVAEVYRANFDRAPKKAVAQRFGVKDRMASTYVDRARKAGYLPPTKQGQKKA